MKESSISNRVKELRKNKGLTQEQLAEEAQLNLRTIQRIENNESTPRGDTLKRISDSLKVGENDVIGFQVREDRNVLLMMTLSQLSFLIFPVMGILVPMAIWIMKKDTDPEVDFEGKKLLNYQIFWTSIAFILLILFFMAKLLHMPLADPYILLIFILYIVNILVISLNSFRISRGWNTLYFQAVKLLK